MFTTLVLNGTPGAFTLQFSDVTRTVSSSAITLGVGTPSALTLTTPPSAFATQPVVRVIDAGNVTFVGATGTMTAIIASGTGGTLSNATATITAGVATFSGLTLSGTPGNFTLRFSDGTRTVTSGVIVLAAAPP